MSQECEISPTASVKWKQKTETFAGSQTEVGSQNEELKFLLNRLGCPVRTSVDGLEKANLAASLSNRLVCSLQRQTFL